MKFIKIIYTTIIESLFPISATQIEIFSIKPEQALLSFSPTPSFEGLAIPKEYWPNIKSIFAYKDKRVEQLIWNIKYKKSEQAVKIGGYALWKILHENFTKEVFASHETYYKKLDEIEEVSSSLRREFLTKNSQGLGTFVATKVSWLGDTTSMKSNNKLLIIPIPITNRRRHERGYNQCELLIDEIHRLDSENHFVFEKNFLVRVHHEDRQTLKNRSERIDSAKGNFEINKELIERYTINDSRFANTAIVIIDDVITTGSTMKEAIDVMRNAGFENVFGVSLAH